MLTHPILRRYSGDVLLLVVCLACVSGLAVFGFTHSRSTQIDPATATSGLYPPEQFSDREGSYRWTNGKTTFTLPNPGGPIVMMLDLAGGPQRTVPVELGFGTQQIPFTVVPALRRYRIILPSNTTTTSDLKLSSDTFAERSGTRTLGLVVSGMSITGGGVVPQTLALLLGAVCVIFALARVLAYPRVLAAGAALLAGGVPALWAGQNWLVAPLLPLVWPGALVLALVASVERTTDDRRQTTGRGASFHHPSSVVRFPNSITTSRVALVIIVAAALLLGVRYFNLIDRYAVNLLFSDEWDFLNPLFRGQGPLEMFFYQHGPHRQGLGGLLLIVIAALSNWNSRVVAFAIGGCMLLAMLAALALKRRLTGRWAASDIVIPLIYLSTVQYEALTVAPNPAHGALPALLAVLVPHAWLLRQPWQRYTLLALLNFALVFTGFGIFMGVVIPALLLVELFQADGRRRTTGDSSKRRFSLRIRRLSSTHWRSPALALIACLGSWALFSVNYHVTTASSCRLFAYERPWEYPLFMALMFSRLPGFAFDLQPVVVGAIASVLFGTSLVLLLMHLQRLLRGETSATALNRAVVILISFSLLFALNTALGRICMGDTGGQASRYMPLLTPAFLGVYLALHQLHWCWPRQIAIALLILLLLPVALPIRSDNEADARGFAEVKRRWSACYLSKHSLEQCTAEAGMAIYPGAATLQIKLDFLEQRRLNLFSTARSEN